MNGNRRDFLLALGYAPRAVEILDRGLHLGKLEHASVHVRHQMGCGDALELWLSIEHEVIHDAAFQYAGCTGLQASASGLTDLIIGMTLDNAADLQVDDIISYLGGIPKSKYDCAEAARETLVKAIAEYHTDHCIG